MIGDLNPFPFQVGGSPSRAEATYLALRKMVGTNGYSRNEESLEAQWRKSKTLGLVALSTFDERATNQYFPDKATDHIVLFEEMLGIVTDVTKTDEERRRTIVPDYTGVPESWYSRLLEQLKLIDERAEISLRDWSTTGTTYAGRAFAPFAQVDGFEYSNRNELYDGDGNPHQRTFTRYPAASDAYRVNVLFDIGSGVAPSRDILRRTDNMKALLNDVIPAWVDFRIVYSIGFILDLSLLDATGFGS